jgi:hypothetical protein
MLQIVKTTEYLIMQLVLNIFECTDLKFVLFSEI